MKSASGASSKSKKPESAEGESAREDTVVAATRREIAKRLFNLRQEAITLHPEDTLSHYWRTTAKLIMELEEHD